MEEKNKMSYSHLFSKGSISRLRLKNRFIMSPAETLYASASGEVTPQIIEFYRRRANGGVGLIILHSVQGNSHVDPLDPYAGSLRIDNNAYIPMMSDLVEAVHNEDSKIACLVSIGGGAKGAGEVYADGIAVKKQRVAPSEIMQSEKQAYCRELSKDEIQQTIINFGQSALRVKSAGFDALCIHALGSYLLAEFLSPLFNRRTDEYGGCAENRWRLLFDLVKECRRVLGSDFPIIVRLSVDELHPNGRTLEETLHFLPLLESCGVNAFDITAGLMDPEHRTIPSIYVEPGINKPYLEAVRKVVKVPLINSGHLDNPEIAEEFLEKGIVDFISVSRGLIAEPDLPNKIKNGKENEIRKCLKCNYCIGHRIMQRLPIRCAFNPYAGHESTEREQVVVSNGTKHCIVVGAGPAGLEASYMLAQKGHQVDLFEESNHFCNGQIDAAKAPPFKERLNNISDYYHAKFGKLPNIKIHFNEQFTVQIAKDYKPDCIFVAVGAVPLIPRIDGIDGENVVIAQDVLLNKVNVKKKVLILGGGQIGVETALFLSERGHEVSIVEQLPIVAKQEEPLTRGGLINKLEKNKVVIYVNKKVEYLHENDAFVSDVNTNESSTFFFDTAIVAFGTRPSTCLASELKENGFEVRQIGDSYAVGNIATSIANAHYVAKNFD